jgi:signal transduction histidine kinase
MKISEILKIGDSIVAEYGKSDFNYTISRQSANNGMVVQVFDQNGNMIVSSNMFGVMHSPDTDASTCKEMIQRLSKISSNRTYYIKDNSHADGKTLVYGAILNNSSKVKYYLLIELQISPIDTTSIVLQNQLVIIIIISMLLSFAISLLIASRLSRPITKITQSAAQLAKGDYSIKFEPGGCSEIDQLASTLNFATTELSKTDGLRKELIANISHDLRTPLTMIKMYAELIRDISGDQPKKRAVHTQVIIEETDRLSSLITDMLDLSKLQSGTQELVRCNFDLAEKSRVILNRFNVLSEHDGYRFEFNSEGDTMVNADEPKIEQVIYNLIGNAVNYTGKDKKVCINVRKSGKRVRFEVIDTGKGISKEKLGQIWERYYRAKETHKRAVVGTGLGLSIVKGILEAHDAVYGIDSTEGKGSTFFFEL